MSDSTLIHIFCVAFSLAVLSSLIYAIGVAQFKAAVNKMNSEWNSRLNKSKS